MKLGVLKTTIQTFSLICPVHPGLLWKYLMTLMTNYTHLTCCSMKFLIITLRSDQLTEEIRELMKSRNVWRETAHRTNDPHTWSSYKNLKQQVRKSIRAAESEFINDQIQNNPWNTNCIWKAIRLRISKRSVSPKVYSKEDKIVAYTFNHFFAVVGKSTNSKIESLAKENKFDM